MSRVSVLEGMQVSTLPMQCEDRRGEMWSWYDTHAVPGHFAREATVARSGPGVLRGIHYGPARGKYVTCLYGEVYDVVADLRRGSPDFGNWTSVMLSGHNRKTVFIPAGLGHAYMSLENSIVVYLYDTPFDPDHYFAVNPLDPDLAIQWPWPDDALIMSDKDRAAPGLEEAPWLPEFAVAGG